jgi:DNA repair exonuclease SbcCD ATPase subunit
MEVVVEFKVKENHYIIKRQRKTSTPSGVYLFVNGEDKTPDSAANTNIEIERILGMPYELFVRIVVFSATHAPFLDLPTRHATQANQSDFIEELFGLTALSQKAELLKLMVKDTERDLTSEKATIANLEQEHTRHKAQVESAKKRVLNWEITNETTIDNLKAKLEQLSEIDVAQQQSLLQTQREIDTDLSGLITTQRTLERDKRDLATKLKEFTNESKHLTDSKCPYCLQDFQGSKDRLKKVLREISTVNKAIGDNSAALDDVFAKVSTLSSKHKEIKAQIVIDSLEELITIDTQCDMTRKRIVELESTVNPFIDPLDEILAETLPVINYDHVNELDKTLEHQKFLLKLLTRKDSFVRKELLDRNIPYLNARLQHHLTFLGLPHKVEFTHEMTAAISILGRTLDFGNLSAGQRARVNLALSLAFRDVLQQIHQHINICMFDEVLDVGLDAVGAHAVVQLLRKVAKDEALSMYIISHKSEFEGMFDNTMVIQMNKGFSYVKED